MYTYLCECCTSGGTSKWKTEDVTLAEATLGYGFTAISPTVIPTFLKPLKELPKFIAGGVLFFVLLLNE